MKGKTETEIQSETVSRLMTLLAAYADRPVCIYIISGRLLGLTDSAIANHLHLTAMRVCQLRRAIIDADAVLASVLDVYTPPHPGLPSTVMEAIKSAGRAQSKPHRQHRAWKHRRKKRKP